MATFGEVTTKKDKKEERENKRAESFPVKATIEEFRWRVDIRVYWPPSAYTHVKTWLSRHQSCLFTWIPLSTPNLKLLSLFVKHPSIGLGFHSLFEQWKYGQSKKGKKNFKGFLVIMQHWGRVRVVISKRDVSQLALKDSTIPDAV